MAEALNILFFLVLLLLKGNFIIFKNLLLFIYLTAPSLSCGMQDAACELFVGPVGSSSLTRGGAQAPWTTREVPVYLCS